MHLDGLKHRVDDLREHVILDLHATSFLPMSFYKSIYDQRKLIQTSSIIELKDGIHQNFKYRWCIGKPSDITKNSE